MKHKAARKQNSQTRKKSILRKTAWILGSIAFSIVLLIVGGAILYTVNDDAASAPLYTGPIIPDENQHPISNRFNHFTEAMEVVEGMDFTGKIFVMTGGHSGTGREAAKAFISAGATVIALARDVAWAKRNLKGLPNIEIEYVDLLKPASINAFTQKFLKTNRPIHALINSAGIIGTPLQRDDRGNERQFSTNVLGHFELTLKLIPALKKVNGARIVNLSSRGHRLGDVIFDDINFEYTEYTGMRAYAQSKTALVLLSVKLDELLKEHNIRAFAVHPGPIPTSDLFAGSLAGFAPAYKVSLMKTGAKLLRGIHATEILNFFRSPENVGDLYKTVQQGGATTAWAAVSADLNEKGGLYLEDCNIAEIVPNDSPAPFGVRPYALNKASADRIWKICQKMTGVYWNNTQSLEK